MALNNRETDPIMSSLGAAIAAERVESSKGALALTPCDSVVTEQGIGPCPLKQTGNRQRLCAHPEGLIEGIDRNRVLCPLQRGSLRVVIPEELEISRPW